MVFNECHKCHLNECHKWHLMSAKNRVQWVWQMASNEDAKYRDNISFFCWEDATSWAGFYTIFYIVVIWYNIFYWLIVFLYLKQSIHRCIWKRNPRSSWEVDENFTEGEGKLETHNNMNEVLSSTPSFSNFTC